MNPLKLFLLATVAVTLPIFSGRAQISPVVTPNDRPGGVVLSDPQAKANGIATRADTRIPKEILERINRFERQRIDYLRQQERLHRDLRGAPTEEERDRIRALIQESRDQWTARLRAFREELKDRLPQLRERLPALNEVLDNARDRARDAAQTARKRRGQD